MGNACTKGINFLELIKDGQPIAEVLLKYYIDYNKLDKTNQEAYDAMIIEFLKDMADARRPQQIKSQTIN
jgi:hypothetical protein